jgi:hypothetical protein
MPGIVPGIPTMEHSVLLIVMAGNKPGHDGRDDGVKILNHPLTARDPYRMRCA